ncbi:MAG: YbfB/YjiJ family MFS transporter [Deltaproteobacteria bacterium]|jgi:MFS family permease|nr:YbfB/YjiJ family MFS transporter [Deltaproteobacteria bacterium]
MDTKKRDWDAVCILLGGIIGMIIAMGIGRFAFSPILPLMQRDLGISNSVAGWLAGLNYLGYLAGAVLCSIVPRLIRTHYVATISLLLSIATTAAMGLTVTVFWWGTLRFVSGFVSAMLFIIVSAEIGGALVRRGYGHWVGALYGGVGAGIALSGLMIPWLDHIGQWDGAWIGMGALAGILAITGTVITKGKIDAPKIDSRSSTSKNSLLNLWPLVAAYFFEGLGYIVTATFIVAIVASTSGLEAYAAYSWVAVGLAAVPSTIFWPLLSRRIGNKKALLSAYMLQASGILVSMHADSVIEVMYAAITFGGTFLGIVALTLAEGNARIPYDGKRAAAVLTASFGIGQVLGPIAAGFLADMQDGFALPLLLASSCVMIGWLFTALDRYFISQKPQ